jgi:hypothetical protein
MKPVHAKLALMMAATLSGVMMGGAEPVKVDDPSGILRKPIPDKLVVLTFDDGPVSGFTVVAPILKSFGFGGSFYICDFDAFRTRKDWYLTWRQMIAMADAGLEIGNHTTGHAGGCRIGGYLSMEDDLVANGVPKPTAIAWPVFAVNKDTYPELVAAGYTFGRGGQCIQITAGTLALSTARSLGEKTDVTISDGAILAMNFKGEMRIGRLIIAGKPQPAATYSAATTPNTIKGIGVLKTQ